MISLRNKVFSQTGQRGKMGAGTVPEGSVYIWTEGGTERRIDVTEGERRGGQCDFSPNIRWKSFSGGTW